LAIALEPKLGQPLIFRKGFDDIPHRIGYSYVIFDQTFYKRLVGYPLLPSDLTLVFNCLEHDLLHLSKKNGIALGFGPSAHFSLPTSARPPESKSTAMMSLVYRKVLQLFVLLRILG